MKTQIRNVVENTESPRFAVYKTPVKSPEEIIKEVWEIIPPVWPLENVIACNPLQGLESLPFEKACEAGFNYFQRSDIPEELSAINRETIKWCQVLFDQGQATLSMPDREKGFYLAWLELAVYDKNLHNNIPAKIQQIKDLPRNSYEAIEYILNLLKVPSYLTKEFLLLLLTSLPGWAGYIKYRTDWESSESRKNCPVTADDYLAMRLVMSMLLWPESMQFIRTSKVDAANSPFVKEKINHMQLQEESYLSSLLSLIIYQSKTYNPNAAKNKSDAQLVFCIDVRSEPFRMALEQEGNYETFGFAGFFGLPVKVKQVSDHEFDSCPVLLDSQHVIKQELSCSKDESKKFYQGVSILKNIKRIYHGLKYSFSTHFGLVETIGIFSGLWMMLKTLLPALALNGKSRLIRFFKPDIVVKPIINNNASGVNCGTLGIDFLDQCQYAANALTMMGLTKNFAPIVAFCGHGSTTQNNAFATALDCGACGGNHGGFNAQILATILNQIQVRNWLSENKGIHIPAETVFIGAQHDTTTDSVTLYVQQEIQHKFDNKLKKLKADLHKARVRNNQFRCEQLGYFAKSEEVLNHCVARSQDWAQTRPEWGLSRNASFIVGSRELSKNIILEGRSFLHSYDYQLDPEGKFLEIILTAPMVVAQWINSQYLFSTWDNIAYGSGSKITQNITGKIGVMQGNGSDLMHGLPLQSVYRDDLNQYHEPMRLLTVVHAPKEMVDQIIKRQSCLQKLFGNGWVRLAVIDPTDDVSYVLQRDFSWAIF